MCTLECGRSSRVGGLCGCTRSQTRGGFPPGPRSYSRRLTPGLDGRGGGGKQKRPRRCGHTRAVSTCTVVFACCACYTGARETLGVRARLCVVAAVVWVSSAVVLFFLRTGTARAHALRSALCRPAPGVWKGGSRVLALATLPGKHADYGTLSFGVSGVPHTERTDSRCHLSQTAPGSIPHLPACASRDLDLNGCEWSPGRSDRSRTCLFERHGAIL